MTKLTIEAIKKATQVVETESKKEQKKASECTRTKLSWRAGQYVASKSEQEVFLIDFIDYENNVVGFCREWKNNTLVEHRNEAGEVEYLMLCPADFLTKPCSTFRRNIRKDYVPDFVNNCINVTATSIDKLSKHEIKQLKFKWTVHNKLPLFE